MDGHPASARPPAADQPSLGHVALRPYQLEGIERVRAEIRAGRKRIVFVLATGGGKTLTAGALLSSAVARGKRVLFVAHRRELINQTYRALNQLGLADLSVIMAGDRRHRPTAPVQIASIDTLRGRLHWPEADLVIIDEAHRSLSKSYLDLIVRYSTATVLGLTATPYRGDNRGLGEAYESLVVIATPRLLMDEGYLVEPIVFTVERLPDVSSVKTTAGDYNEAQLAEAVDKAELVGNIVEHWITHARGMRTVVFAVNVAHSRHITERFVAAGIAAEHLDGTMRAVDRDAILARLERGATTVVCSCGVLSEGWDQPSVKCAVLARPTKSTGLYLQQAGRILRPYQDLPAIILDHAGNALEHGLPQDDREFALHMPKRRAKAPSVTTCQQCFAVLPAATRTCPHCGYVFAAALAEPKRLDERDGKLVEITAPKNADEAERHAMRRKIQSLATHYDRSSGLRDGETNRRLRVKFGKSRSEMTLLELYAVWQYLDSGAAAIEHVPRLDAPPAFLQEVVTWPL